MALSYRTLREIPYLPDYARAAEWEAKVPPIRGRDTVVKPLGRRNQCHHRIERCALSSEITIMRGGQRLITFRPNGEILLTAPKWSQKAAEAEIMDEVLGWKFKSEHGAFWVYCTPDDPAAVEGWYPLRTQDAGVNIFTRPDTTIRFPPTFHDPNFRQTHVLNRKGMKEMRAAYGEFISYARGMAKLRHEEPKPGTPAWQKQQLPMEEYGEAFGWNEYEHNPGRRWPMMPNPPQSWRYTRKEAEELCALMQSDKPEDQYKAFLSLLPQRVLLTPDATERAAERATMMACAEDILVTKIHKDGKRRKDAYAWCLR